ncbi:transposase [Bradyrhizobium sp. RT6a]
MSVSLSTVGRTKRRFVEGNLERALSEEPRPGAERKLTGKEEALLVATACAKPPAGCKRWTLTLLADAMVKLTDHNSLSGETVRRRLTENDLKPWRRDMWCIPMSTANTLPAWRTCSTSTPRRRIPPGRWSASTRLPSS